MYNRRIHTPFVDFLLFTFTRMPGESSVVVVVVVVVFDSRIVLQ